MAQKENVPVRGEELGLTVLFADLPASELSGLAAHAQAWNYDEGELILRRGEPGLHLYLIDRGRVRVTVHASGAKLLTLGTLGAGDHFGELALLDRDARSADVIAEEASRVFLIPRDDFLRFVEVRPRVADRMVTILRRALRQGALLAGEPGALDVAARLTRAIQLLAEEEQRVRPVIEIIPVQLRGGQIWSYKPRKSPSWRVSADSSLDPGDLVIHGLHEMDAMAEISHSTSWRYDEGRLVLTYVAVLPDDEPPSGERLTGEPVSREDLARGSALAAPAEIAIAQVIEHGLRHLSWLSRDDPVIKETLSGDWIEALESYEPEPFRSLTFA